MADTLKDKTARGIFWGALNNGVTQVLNLVFGIFLARLLTPEDYTLVGVLAIFSTLAGNLQDSGFGQGLINMKHPTANDYNSVFWFNISVSLSIYVILFFAAPFIANFYGDPRLTGLARFVFLSFVMSSTGISSGAYLFKNLRNRDLAIIGIVALLCSGITGVILAFMGFAFWALAIQQFVYISIVAIGRNICAPRFHSFHIDFGPVKGMFKFSVNLLITNIVTTLNQNFLTAIFAKLYSFNKVGNFTQAYKWNAIASSFVYNTIGQVAQPVMVDVRDDHEREKRVFRKMLRFAAFLAFPALFGMSLVSHEFIILTIGEKWSFSATLLRILCIGGAFLPFYILYQNLAVSHGRSSSVLKYNVSQMAIQLVLIVALHDFGIITMVVCVVAFQMLWLLPWQMEARKLINYTFLEFLRDIVPFLLTASLTMVLVYIVTLPIHSNIILLAVRIPLAAIIYYAVMKTAKVQILSDCEKWIKARLRKS